MSSLLTLTPNPALDVWTRTVRVEPTHKLRCAPAHVHPGGGGINVARVFARLGGSALAVFPHGGARGERLRQLLAQEAVEALPVPVRGETRESFAVREDGTGREYRFVLPGPALEPGEWQDCLDQTARNAPGHSFVVGAGSLPPGVPQDAYAQLARRLGPRGPRLVVDTSGVALAAALRGGVYLFKPSLREMEELAGRPLPDRGSRVRACREVIGRQQAQVIALSLGDAGGIAVTASEAWQARALPVSVVSTIGAGDSFLAGFVWSLAHGGTVGQALRQAIATSAASLLGPGTALGEAHQIAALLPDVRIERVDD